MSQTNTNTNLSDAKKAKRDEFYTQLSDIENEMRHYRKHFKGKTILCNCDDPFESNFFKYFVLNFNRLGLKKLIATCYTGSPIAGTQLSFEDLGKEFIGSERAYKAIVTEVYDATGNGGVDMLDVAELFRIGKNTIEELEGDGDFRSAECLELMDQADIIVTNPPFSLFGDYLALLNEHKKSFVIIGNKNAITLKEVFPLIKENKLWIGAMPMSREMYFDVPQSYIDEALEQGKNRSVVMHNDRWMHRSQSIWFTNLDLKKRHEELILVKKYTSDEYPHYDYYDAVDVSRTADIPYDYEGVMGVPISFLDKYSPTQFEILDARDYALYDRQRNKSTMLVKDKDSSINGKPKYVRILVRNKHPEQPKA